MTIIRSAFLALLFSLSGLAHAMDGVFDRSVEVDKYIQALKDYPRGTLVQVSRDIYTSGVADPRLAAAISERLLSDYTTIGSDREQSQYGVFMVKALASTGVSDYKSTLQTIVKTRAKSSKTVSAARGELDNFAWHQTKNDIMASRKYHSEGDDPKVSRLVNLLMSSDYSYKHWAAERMNWEQILDPRLMQVLAVQVQEYVDRGGKTANALEDDTIANFVKLLGYSKNREYRPLMEKVLAEKGISSGVKRHAKYAMDKLW